MINAAKNTATSKPRPIALFIYSPPLLLFFDHCCIKGANIATIQGKLRFKSNP